MAKRIATFACNTNLAAEYYVMSLLSRAGKEAYLSLGNKKGVDIIVQTGRVSICLIEVKGVNQNNDWLIGNTGRFLQSPDLFYALQCFNAKIDQLSVPPISGLSFLHNQGKQPDTELQRIKKRCYCRTNLSVKIMKMIKTPLSSWKAT